MCLFVPGVYVIKIIIIIQYEEYKYLGITVEGGKHGGFNSIGDRMKEAND